MITNKITPAEAIAIALTCLPLMSKRLIGPHGKEVALVLSAVDQAGYDIVAKAEGKA